MSEFSRRSAPQLTRLRPVDLLDEAAFSLVSRMWRTMLTSVGTLVGVATLVATVGLSQTAAYQIASRFDAYEATTVSVYDNSENERVPPFTEESLDRVRDLDGVVAAGESWGLGELSAARLPRTDLSRPPEQVSVVAADPETLVAVGADVARGRLFGAFHDEQAQPVVVLGATAARRLGIADVQPATSLYLGGVKLHVLGIIQDAPRRPELLLAAVVPRAVADRVAAGDDQQPPRRELTVQVRLGSAQVIGAVLPATLDPFRQERYGVEVPPTPEIITGQVQGDLSGVFIALAAAALLAGLVGIFSASLVSVLERAREFGLRRSVGARGRHIGAHVLIDAVIVGLFGGVSGLAVALMFLLAVSTSRNWTPVIDPALVAAAPAIGVAIGVVAGLYPAWRAARIEPSVALRE